MLCDGTYHYFYDNEGNRTAKFVGTPLPNDTIPSSAADVTTYQWDYRNRLTKVTHYSNYRLGTTDSMVEYTYDYLDRRIRMKIDSNVAGGESPGCYYNVYQGDNVALEIKDPAGLSFTPNNATVSHRYLYGAAVDEILASENASGAVLWGLGDNEGTIRDIVDGSTGKVVDHRKYDSFGNLTYEKAPATDFIFGYTGQALDSTTKLYDYDHRWYDPAVGRFASEDPSGFAAGDANLYRYVGNNPLNGTDPSGLVNVWSAIPSGSGGTSWRLVRDDSSYVPDVSEQPIFDKPVPQTPQMSACAYPWYERALDAVTPYFSPTEKQRPIENFELNTVIPAVSAGSANASRVMQGSARTVSGAVGTTLVTGPAYLLGVPYGDDMFAATTKLTRLGLSDVGASYGFGGNQWGDTLNNGNIISISAQYMANVRNSPGVSPSVRDGKGDGKGVRTIFAVSDTTPTATAYSGDTIPVMVE